ncbi:PREDICTED: K(+) efflux antiporter 4-like [Ipomoea nil]|uniref:K(+) efflux antiporter 4-like n=1 Tax=Ipomoea nil TaxID=35883 RepID=UPI000901EB17|nr:PREDICTED: K(+) efflux antiporter 4-like [Ipomoea nil]
MEVSQRTATSGETVPHVTCFSDSKEDKNPCDVSLVTTPLLFKLIPAVVHLGVLLRWFSPDNQTELGLKGETLRSESVKQRIALISKDLLIH